MTVPKIERVLNRLDDPEYSYTREMGRVVSIDGTDPVYVGNSSGAIETVQRAVQLDNGQTQTLVIFNSEARLPFSVGDELWAVGRREGAGRLRAMAVVVPSLQIYADLTKENDNLKAELMFLIASVLTTAVGFVLIRSLMAVLFPVGLTLSVLALCCVLGGSGVKSRRVSASEWHRIERAFGGIHQFVE